ncbi:hypothetical protein [Brasilonema bromeliae]|uniref:hypothetical protein n=1 Tax=Brasilonema bromeliae TaxID=383615 RepID=UPI00145E5633|nr:hypothetical protein [Brasilonema bromeliae]
MSQDQGIGERSRRAAVPSTLGNWRGLPFIPEHGKPRSERYFLMSLDFIERHRS